MRKNNGITLISLVITIAVLIILASIATYSGVNVIRQSKLNKFTSEMNIMQTEVNSLYDKYSTGTEEEQNTILNYGEVLDSNASKVFTTSTSGITDSSGYRYYTQATLKELGIDGVEGEFYVNVPKRSVISCEGLEYEGITYYTPEQLPNGVYNVEYEKVQVDEDGYFEKTSTINGELPNENNPTIPGGFKPVDTATSKWPRILTTKPTQENLNNGLVIEDKSGNQFVWIPVKTVVAKTEEDGDINKAMAVKVGENYRGLLYNFTDSDSEVIDGCITTTSDYREPDVLKGSNYNYYDNYYHNNAGYYSLELMKDGLQQEYNKMIESVKKYKGFYVGRYELGLDGNKNPTSKKAESGITTADASKTETYMWYGLYVKSKEYAPEKEQKSVVSSMIWGSQYDAMMNWMQDNGKNITSSNSLIQNNSYVTGSKETDVILNVFDLYACHWEWTLEAYYDGYRVYRGGGSGGSNSPSYRGSSYDPTITYSDVSSRLTLYIR